MDAATAGIADDPEQAPAPIRPRSRFLAVAVVAILLTGLGLRLDFAWEGRTPVFDAAAYARIAANLDRDRGFTLGSAATQPASDYSPGLPLLAAGVYKASGGVHERLARLVLALIGSLSILFAYLIGRRLAGSAAGLIAAAAVAIYPALLEYQGMLMGEPLAAALLSGAVLGVLWAEGPGDSARRSCRGVRGALRAGSSSTPLTPRHPRVKWLLPGILFGALAMVRPEYLVIALLVSLVVLGRGIRADWRVSLSRAAILLAGVAIVVAPWTIRNAIALHRFVPVSTGGGQVLFAGTYLPSGGDPERVGVEVLKRHPELRHRLPSEPRLEQILAALAAQRYPGMESDRALGRMGREQLWHDLTLQPLEYADFVVAKLARLWWHGPRGVMRRPPWEELHWALLALGLAGLIALARRRPWEAAVLATVLLASTAIGAILVASPRRVLVMLPLLAALAGVGATACRDSLARRWSR